MDKPTGQFANLSVGDGVSKQGFGSVTLESFLGIKDGNGGFTPWFEMRVENITRNFTDERFLTDIFGGIEVSYVDNFVYRATGINKIFDATFTTSEVGQNIDYPTEFVVNGALVNKWIQGKYKMNTYTQYTTNDLSTLLQNQETQLMINKKQYEINKTIYMILLTCLSTGNFKIIRDLSATDDPTGTPSANNKIAYSNLRKTLIAYEMKWTSLFRGQPGNYEIFMSPYTKMGALESMGQTSITGAADKAFGAYQDGELTRWFDFYIREYPWLENNFFFQVAPTDDQLWAANATSETFDFTSVSAVIFGRDTIQRYAKPTNFLFATTFPSGFFPAALVGGDNVLDMYRVINYTLDAFVKPFNESRNMVILNKTANVDNILNARKALATLYPTLYRGIDPTTGYMVGDSDGTKTKNIISQWIEAAQHYKYGDNSIPTDSNIFGFKPLQLNLSGITKASYDTAKTNQTGVVKSK